MPYVCARDVCLRFLSGGAFVSGAAQSAQFTIYAMRASRNCLVRKMYTKNQQKDMYALAIARGGNMRGSTVVNVACTRTEDARNYVVVVAV